MTYFVTATVDVSEAAMWVKSMCMLKSWSKIRKVRKCGNQRHFTQIHSLLRRAYARGSADIIYHM